MKMEHKAIIERAERIGLMPSELAHELLVHDLVSAALTELRNIKSPFGKLSKENQQEVIERITDKAQTGVSLAISIINSRGAVTIPCAMKQIKVDAKHLTVTAMVDGKDPNRHGLTDSAGSLCLLVIAPDDYSDGLDFIKPDPDQHEMPLSAGAIAEAIHQSKRFMPEERKPANTVDDLVDAEWTPPEADQAGVGKEFGEFDYADASQLVVLHGDVIDVAWLQRRLAIDSEAATSLILSLLDDNLIQLEAEAEDRIDYTYKVLGKLADTIDLE